MGNGVTFDNETSPPPHHAKPKTGVLGAPVTVKILALVLAGLVGAAWELFKFYEDGKDKAQADQTKTLDRRLDRMEDKIDYVIEGSGRGFPVRAPKRVPDDLDGG